MRIRNLEGRVFIGLVLATTMLFLWVVRAFLAPVFWAAVLAVLFQPVQRRFLLVLRGRRGLAASGTTLLVVLAVLLPFGLLVGAVAQQALALYGRIQTGDANLAAPAAFIDRSLPVIADMLSRFGIDVERVRTGVETAALTATQYLGSQALALGQNAVTLVVMFALMLYFLFFFLRDGERITEAMIRALPMGDERERRLFGKFGEVSRATVKGTLIVAGVQGALGGILFFLAGIQTAIFWGVVMGVLSLLPAVGPALVWAPAAILFFVAGEFWRGILLVVGGTVVVGLVDNLLRPILVGRQTKMPDYLVLLATLGGLTVFGLSGFVAGPMIAALFLVVWEMFADEYSALDSSVPASVATESPNAAWAESPRAIDPGSADAGGPDPGPVRPGPSDTTSPL